MKIKKLVLGVSFALSQSAMAVGDFDESFAGCRIPTGGALFNATICIDDRSVSYSGSSAESLIDQFDEAQLKNHFKGYYNKNTSKGLFIADFRGLEMRLSYPNRNSSRMIFEVPSLGIRETFNGATRDESNDQLKDYLKQDGDRILKKLVEQSAVSPIAGNPSSAQTQMAEDEFNAGTGGSYTVDFAHKASTMGLGLQLGRYQQDGHQVNAFTVPLSYTFSMKKGKELTFRMPITYVEVEGAKSYSAVLGVSYKTPVNERWALTPSLSYGVAASEDLGAAAQMASLSLTSNYMLYKGEMYTVSMGNMFGYFKTLPVSIGDYSIDVDLTNEIVRNGIVVSRPIGKIKNTKLTIDAFVTDSRVLGDEVFVDQFNEIGFVIGPQKGMWKDDLRHSSQDFGIGIKYLRTNADISGFQLTLGYKF